MHTTGKIEPLPDSSPLAPIIIHPVENGLILEAGRQRRVFEVGPGRRAEAVRGLLQAVAAAVADGVAPRGMEVRIEVRDRASGEQDASTPPSEWMSVADVEREFKLEEGYLEELRRRGRGPRYSKPTSRTVRYRRQDVRDWMLSSMQATGDQPCGI